jgi:hypothetical protein
MPRLLFTVVFLSSILIQGTAVAENCELKVVTSTYEKTSSYHSDYRLAKYVKKEDWNELSKSAGAAGKIYGVPVSASYSEFQKAYSSMESQYGESLTQDQAQQIYWTGLDKNAADAYQKCLELSVFGQLGLHIAVVEASTDAVLLKVRWTLPGSKDPIKIRWTVKSVEGTELPTEIDPGDNYVSVSRPKSSGIFLGATYNGIASETVKIAPIPPAPPPPIENCVSQRPAGVCRRCEFDVDDLVGTGSNSKDYICRKMPAGALINARAVSIVVSLAKASDCWLDVRMKGPNDKETAIAQGVGCPGHGSASTSFVKPSDDGIGSVAFYVEKCGSGKLCSIKGKLVLEAKD